MNTLEDTIRAYEESLAYINDKIDSLEAELKCAHNGRRIHELNYKIEKYCAIQYDLTSAIYEMKQHLK